MRGKALQITLALLIISVVVLAGCQPIAAPVQAPAQPAAAPAAFCGFTAGLAGLVMTSRLGQTRAGGAVGMDFDSVIAVVLGGTSLFGGSGGPLRTVVGVLILGILNNVMVLGGVPYEAQWIGKGVVFLLVAASDAQFRRHASALLLGA